MLTVISWVLLLEFEVFGVFLSIAFHVLSRKFWGHVSELLITYCYISLCEKSSPKVHKENVHISNTID